ncbi:MAG: class II fructose-bisphosphate aldolase [Christensenellales bacterium]
MDRAAVSAWLIKARDQGYALGSFSPRNTFLIHYVLLAAIRQRSPVIVQISSNELKWFDISPAAFAEAFFRETEGLKIPAILHLDHTYDIAVLRAAVEAGFHSVMFDGSKLPFAENVRQTREAAELAHSRDVFLEAELGNIGGADKLETGGDDAQFTDPGQAEAFARETGCDSLAVSIGTAHGVYAVKNPRIDFDRLREIRQRVPVPLVLHGGSGLPVHTVKRAIHLEGLGGISKLNIATDLELVFQKSLGIGRIPDRDIRLLDPPLLAKAGQEVQALCEDRMIHYLLSSNRA